MSYSGSFRFQRYEVNKTIKNIRFFGYGGGMVSQIHPEKLGDGQSVLLENIDVVAGGTVTNRGAYSQVSNCTEIHYGTMDEIKSEGMSMTDLSAYTFDSLLAHDLIRLNTEVYPYYKTMDRIKNDSFTMNDLKSYSMTAINQTGVKEKENGNVQGVFRYNKLIGHIDIIAMKGVLYTIENSNTYKRILITGLPSFQTTRPIDAVQYRDKLYIATGSGIVIYDGTTASLLQPYAPNGLEALYIGTNAYAQNPDNFMTDTTGAADVILGVTVDQRYGIINQNVTFTAYIQKIETDVVEYLFETKTTTDTSYSTGQSWGTSKTFTTSFRSNDDYMVRVSLRQQGTTLILSQYVLPKYTVNSTYTAKIEPSINFDNISTCNRIFVHYDYLMVYGDTTNPDYLYMSHSDNFTYFPRTNIIPIIDPLRGMLESAVQFKNFLVLFTTNSIQMLTGTSVKDFALVPIHTSLGTTKPYSVQVMKNYVAFIGQDNGVYILKSFSYASSDKMNVERIDDAIKDLITGHINISTRILSCIYNNQYYLYIQTPTDNFIYRYYYDMGVWVRDKISMQFKTLDILDNTVTASSALTGIIYNLKRGSFFDGVNDTFEIHIISKDYDMNMPHHRKKMKQFQLLAELSNYTVINVDMYGDNDLLTSQSITHDPDQNSDADKLKVTTSGRFRYAKVDITIPITEDIQLLGYAFIFKLNTPK